MELQQRERAANARKETERARLEGHRAESKAEASEKLVFAGIERE